MLFNVLILCHVDNKRADLTAQVRSTCIRITFYLSVNDFFHTPAFHISRAFQVN